MSWLLDTSVVSEAMRARPDGRVLGWLAAQAPDALFLSALTIGEIKEGIERLAPGRRRDALGEWLDGDLMVRYGDRVLPVDPAVARRWGTLRAAAIAQGLTPPAIDSLIAATAAHHGLTLVTRNVKDFRAFGIPLLDPWA